MEDKQAVVEKPDAQPEAVPEGNDAQEDDLESLLSEYDGGSAPEKPEQGDDDKVDLETVHKELTEWRKEKARDEYQRDISGVVKGVRGDLDPEAFDDVLVEAWIDAEARKDPRLAKAWQDRKANPRQFDKVVSQLGRSFRKKFAQLPDRNLTEDREAVANAVRGASKQSPTNHDDIDTKKVAQMSDADFEKFVKEVGAKS